MIMNGVFEAAELSVWRCLMIGRGVEIRLKQEVFM